MAKIAFGFKSLKYKEVDGTTYADVPGDVYKDTVILEQEDGEMTDHYAEGVSSPIFSTKSAGKTTLTFELIGIGAADLGKFCGGEVETGTWSAPPTETVVELAFEITTKDETVFEIPKGVVDARPRVEPNQKGVFKLLVKVTALGTDTTTSPFKIKESAGA